MPRHRYARLVAPPKPGLRHGRGLGRLTPTAIKRVELQAKALELRRDGKTWPAIAKALGRCPQTVIDWVRAALRDMVQEPADTVRGMELCRLDFMWRKVLPQLKDGDLKAIETALKIMQRRAALLGLDAPVRAALQNPDGGPVSFVVELPTQAASIEDWAKLTGTTLDVEAEPEATAALGVVEEADHVD